MYRLAGGVWKLKRVANTARIQDQFVVIAPYHLDVGMTTDENVGILPFKIDIQLFVGGCCLKNIGELMRGSMEGKDMIVLRQIDVVHWLKRINELQVIR